MSTARSTASPLAVTWKLLLAFAAAAAVLVLAREAVGHGPAPPVWLMLAAGAVIMLATGTALVAVVRFDLSLPWSVAGYALGYHALVVLVKYVFAPHGVYLVNRTRPLTGLIAIDETLGVVAAAAVVLALYTTAYVVLYRIIRRRAGVAASPGPRRVSPRALALLVIVGVLLLAGATGGFSVVAAIILAGAGLEYLEFVFGSGMALLVAAALGGATWLATRTFATVADRAQLTGDATMLVSFFWVGLAFLALYHALWVLYMLMLITLWPLRAVVPK